MKREQGSAADIARYRRQLGEWLHEWHLDRMLQDKDKHKDEDDAGLAGIPGNSAPLTDGPEPHQGQIRLLYPDVPETRRQPLYVLMLNSPEKDTWLTAPFGRLALPAIPGEWGTGLRPLPLRVFCAWNARRTSRERLVRSWHAGDFTAKRLKAAREIVATCFEWHEKGWTAAPASQSVADAQAPTGAQPRAAGNMRRGPPLVHPADPRWEYLASEAARGDALGVRWGRPCDSVYRLEPFVGHSGSVRYLDQAEKELLKAAEKKGIYGVDRSDSIME